jgi:NADH-quinone oxidoreductase subunit J
MNVTFYIAAIVAIVATFMAITRRNPVHALLYLVVSLLAVALVFYVIGAPFIAALEVIIYAGAIVVLFLFVVMILGNALVRPPELERDIQHPRTYIGPGILGVVLLLEFIYLLVRGAHGQTGPAAISPQQLGEVLFGPYILGVEIASLLLLAGLVGAYYLGRPAQPGERDGETNGDRSH